MVALTAKRELRYAGRPLVAGDAFDASEKDARVLIALKKAEAGAIAAPAELPTKALEAPKPAPLQAQPVEATAGAYLRRDMIAEDGPTGAAKPSQSSRRGRRQNKRG